MKDPIFLLQKGDVMPIEKLACSFSRYPVRIASYDQLSSMSLGESKFNFVPVGSVEFTREYAKCANLELPAALDYPETVIPFFERTLQEVTFERASRDKFIKPSRKVKAFSANIKSQITQDIDPEEPVWESEVVPFGSEFRFYIQDTVTRPYILGWARYDDLSVVNPEPDFDLVEKVADIYHKDLGPGAYSIDIGWRPDLQRYSLVEVNDAWALGYYENQDPQSNPPSRQQYADMLVSRWTQIIFCNIV
jgi:hypothetical protein